MPGVEDFTAGLPTHVAPKTILDVICNGIAKTNNHIFSRLCADSLDEITTLVCLEKFVDGTMASQSGAAVRLPARYGRSSHLLMSEPPYSVKLRILSKVPELVVAI